MREDDPRASGSRQLNDLRCEHGRSLPPTRALRHAATWTLWVGLAVVLVNTGTGRVGSSRTKAAAARGGALPSMARQRPSRDGPARGRDAAAGCVHGALPGDRTPPCAAASATENHQEDTHAHQHLNAGRSSRRPGARRRSATQHGVSLPKRLMQKLRAVLGARSSRALVARRTSTARSGRIACQRRSALVGVQAARRWRSTPALRRRFLDGP